MKLPKIVPRATYRLQLHQGFTLLDALALVPYLDMLGISHVYASPLLKARPGSTHGYDVCDPTCINPEIGTEADLQAFMSALHARTMGLVLDIVPNHLATAPENPWWWDVLKHGRTSAFADYFDIDWEGPDSGLRGKVLLPVLGDELERVLELGQIRVIFENSETTLRYFKHRFPVNPQSLPVSGEVWEKAEEINSQPQALARLLEQQHYLLAFWRQGDTRLNYRRFFTIAHLAGLRVELPQVFADAHNRILDWQQRGWLDGLRVDHPDGLYDPQQYLQRLGRAAPGAWIVVEKILEPGEDLAEDWPVAGTTGYDFLNRAAGLFIDPGGERELTDFYAEFTGEPTDYAAVVREKKRWMLRHRLGAEVTRLKRLLQTIAVGERQIERFNPDQLGDAVIELAASFPVYRTYIRAKGAPGAPAASAASPDIGSLVSKEDAVVVSEATALARSERPDLAALFDFLGDLLLLRVPGMTATEFVMRFQQLTGAAMAKGAEDTAFYCFNRLIALNEVGGDPARFAVSIEAFHRECGRAQERWPNTMLASSTHDTKRSEDVRARLALLSEIPAVWTATVQRWSGLNEKHRRRGWPDRNAEYFFYQTLAGAWPLSLDRALACMEKSVREAKLHTNWSDQNADYEGALADFVTGTLGDRVFLEEVERFVAPLVRPGFVNSLAQTLIKLTAPGVPDIYQGTELGDFSLVDPDNRRAVDFRKRADSLAEMRRRLGDGGPEDVLRGLLRGQDHGAAKLFLIYQTLQFRRSAPELFEGGSYVPLTATGQRAQHICAFARTLNDATAITVVPRLVLGLTAGREQPFLGEKTWEGTRLNLPQSEAACLFQNILTGESLRGDIESAEGSLCLADVLRKFPVALLTRVGASPA